MPKTLTIIIPTYNRKETLRTTLLSLVEQTSSDFEVIVSDDGSNDGTEEMVRGLKLPFPIRHLWQKNSGRSAARNLGIRNAGGDMVLFIDDHMIAHKDLVREHIASHRECAGTSIGVIRGRVEFYTSVKDAPPPGTDIARLEARPSLSEQDPFRNFITNNVSITREALLKVEGFDEHFREYGLQDSELGYRIRKAGYRFRRNPNAVGYIFGVGLSFAGRCSRRRQVGRSSVLFCKKHPALLIRLNLSAHFIARSLYRLLSAGNSFLIRRAESKLAAADSQRSRKLVLFYNFLAGINEGFERYADVRFSKFSSSLHKPRILMVSHNFRFEGAPISLYNLAKAVDRAKYDILFVSPRTGPLREALEKRGIRSRILGNVPFLLRRRIARLIIEEKIDVVHVNTLDPAWAVEGAVRVKAPVLWHIRETPDFYGAGSLNRLRDKVDLFICVSDWVRRAFHVPAEKARVVFNGVDVAAFNPNIDSSRFRGELGLSADDVLVGLIGSISERKGTDIFVRAAEMALPSNEKLKFAVVGEPVPGEFFRHRFGRLIRSLNIDERIVFTGSRKDIAEVMASMDIIVNCSRQEPSGRTIIEGMALEKPVIGTRVGGIPEIVTDTETGLLIEPESAHALSQAILFLAGDRKRREEMGKLGRERIIRHFSMEAHVRSIESIYDELIGRSE